MEGICDAFLARYAPVSPAMTQVSIGPCSSWRGLPAPGLNREFMCWGSRRRRRRRTLGVFFSDVSCARHSRCTLNSSSALVARAAISKIQSRSLSSSDFPVRTRPEMHRRCPAFELFFDATKVEKQLPTRTAKSDDALTKNNLVAYFSNRPIFCARSHQRPVSHICPV